MKVARIIFITAFLAIGLWAAVSCEQMSPTAQGGDEICFSSQISGNENNDTKAVYGGDNYTEGGKKKEHIYWSVGDIVKIYCKNGSTSEIIQSGVTTDPSIYQADYVISEVGSDRSKATIVLNSATTPIGLRWNDDASVVHNFYAVYPSFQTVGKQITRAYSNGINGKAIYCNLAESQNTLAGALTGNDGNYTLAPDMKWMLMHGHASYTRSNFPAKGTVFIEFQPLTTAIQFTIQNSATANLVIKQLQLLSDSQISGTFDIADVTSLDSNGFPVAAHNLTVVGKQVTLDFTSSNVTIANGKTFTFTFFLSPVSDVNDLKFRIIRGDGSTMTTRLGYTDGTGLKFPRCKKSFVTGIMVPEGVQWTIDYEPVLTSWVDDGGEDLTLN